MSMREVINIIKKDIKQKEEKHSSEERHSNKSKDKSDTNNIHIEK